MAAPQGKQDLNDPSTAVVIVSGGMDSVTLAHFLHKAGYGLHLLSFDYGQRHKKELEFARKCADRLGAKHSTIDLTTLTTLLKGSALTDTTVEVPEGHYEDATMVDTIVPNRNAIMLAIAYGVAAAQGADMVAIGVHNGDHAIYPDCRPDFIRAFEDMQGWAMDGYLKRSIYLSTPFIDYTKAQIVLQGAGEGIPFEETWSCYKGGEIHCGKCGTCVERREAFELAGVTDPTTYEE
jgi:7-cyano-7-deazaguanine synthase